MSERVLTCVYCGHQYPDGTNSHGENILTDHISHCDKHPMSFVIKERDLLRSALAGIVGASEPDELRKIEVVMRSFPAPEQDKAVTLNAIHALIATASKQSTELTP